MPREMHAIILDRPQAELWNAGADRGTALSFSPGATALLRDAGRTVIEAEDVTTAFTHARTTVRSDRILTGVTAVLDRSGLDTAERESLRIFLAGLVPPLLLVQGAMGRCDAAGWQVVTGGRVHDCATGADALRLLASELEPPFHRYSTASYSRAHARFARWLNRMLAPLWRGRPTVCHLDHGNAVPGRMGELLLAARPEAVMLFSRRPANTMAETLGKALRSLANRAVPSRRARGIFVFRPGMSREGDHPPLALAGPLVPQDPLLDAVLTRAAARYWPLVRMGCEAGAAFAARHRPDVVLLDGMIYPTTIRAAIDLGAQGARLAMVNHGSHTDPSDRLSDLASRYWAGQGRVTGPAVTDLVCKNPETARLAGKLAPGTPRIHALPLFRRVPRREGARDLFRIVLAGNFQAVRSHVPWLTETPGEFLRATLEFAEAAATVDGVHLAIKLKARKPDVPDGWLAGEIARRGLSDRVSIDTSTPMTRLLAQADLMVSNLSTTIEEALICRMPVFLNTWHRRYTHLPARLTPPAPGDRAAVYAVRHRDRIAPMLAAIRDAHRTALGDDEVRGLVWEDERIETPEAFATALFEGSPGIRAQEPTTQAAA